MANTLTRMLAGGALAFTALSGTIATAGAAVAAPADPPPCESTSAGQCRAPNLAPPPQSDLLGPTPGPQTAPPDEGQAEPYDVFQKGLEVCADSGVPEASPACDFAGQLYGPVRQASPND